MSVPKTSRREFLRATLGGAAVAAVPSALSAQTKSFKLGIVHPVTGSLTEPGQACRLGAKMATEAINAAGGIKALGGTKLELLFGDTQAKPDVARAEAERLIGQGAQMLIGAFDSGSTAAMVPVVSQREDAQRTEGVPQAPQRTEGALQAPRATSRAPQALAAMQTTLAGVFLQLFHFGLDRIQLVVRLLLTVLLRLA